MKKLKAEKVTLDGLTITKALSTTVISAIASLEDDPVEQFSSINALVVSLLIFEITHMTDESDEVAQQLLIDICHSVKTGLDHIKETEAEDE